MNVPERNPHAELIALRGFAQDVMEAWPEGGLDGGVLQEIALRHGLLREKIPAPTKPCGEACACGDYYTAEEWRAGVRCYERAWSGDWRQIDFKEGESKPKWTEAKD